MSAKPKASSTARGYGSQHKQLRKQWAAYVTGGTVTCARCGRLIEPGTPWDLGHSDDRTTWTGPEHASCNRAAGGRKGTAAPTCGRCFGSRHVGMDARGQYLPCPECAGGTRHGATDWSAPR